MLDKIQNNSSEIISQSQNLDRIRGLGVSNPFEEDDKGFFIDESVISTTALEKYQKELDIARFSEIFKQTDEKSANELVLKDILEGKYSIDDNDFLAELLNNEEFLNDVIK